MREYATGRPFDYVGDSHADLNIFNEVQTAYIVGSLRYPKASPKIRSPLYSSTFSQSYSTPSMGKKWPDFLPLFDEVTI